jgi:hypothetical protein
MSHDFKTPFDFSDPPRRGPLLELVRDEGFIDEPLILKSLLKCQDKFGYIEKNQAISACNLTATRLDQRVSMPGMSRKVWRGAEEAAEDIGGANKLQWI